ncbi:hypothetical protein BGX30_007534 [Mortierella sp. GBA39]|nr:hypothetical protein BGX30_007534 [Mortierella sp. GBA39]
MVGLVLRIRWAQSSDCMYLATVRRQKDVTVWKLLEQKGEYSLQLVWTNAKAELTMKNTNLCGVEGLSPVDLKLVKQREAITESEDESEDEPEVVE